MCGGQIIGVTEAAVTLIFSVTAFEVNVCLVAVGIRVVDVGLTSLLFCAVVCCLTWFEALLSVVF